MGRTSTTESSKTKASKAEIGRIATIAAKKAAKDTATKVAKKEATRVAKKVGTQAALNPDYEASDDLNEGSDTEEGFEIENEGDYELDSYGEDDTEESSVSSLFGASTSSSNNEDEGQEGIEAIDIFSYANKLLKKGVPVRIQIKKNGLFLATHRKPYSEEQLQKDHGEGHYQIILRNDAKGTFIKQQSLSVAPMAVPVQEIVAAQKEREIESKVDKMFDTFSTMQERMQESQADLVERLLAEQRDREAKEEERRREEIALMKEQERNNSSVLASVLQAALAPKPDSSGGMTAILQMMQQQQQSTTQMIMEMSKNNATMIQEMRRDTQMMMDKFTNMTQEQTREFQRQLSDMSGKKQEGMSPLEVFQMITKERESGFNFGLKLNQMAKEMAGDDVTPVAPKGIVESLVDNLGKLAPLMLAAAPQAPAVTQAPIPLPAPQRPVPQAQRAPAPRPTAPVTASSAQTRPVAPKAPPVVAKPGQSTTVTKVATNPKAAKMVDNAALKQKVLDTCVPLVGHAIQNRLLAGQLGDGVIESLRQQGITVQTAVSLVSKEDILTLAFETHGLPRIPELETYLKDFHDYLQQKAST